MKIFTPIRESVNPPACKSDQFSFVYKRSSFPAVVKNNKHCLAMHSFTRLWIHKLNRSLVLIIFAALGMMVMPQLSTAQITQPTAWTNLYNVGVNTASGSTFAIAGGSNRILVVGITATLDGNGTIADPTTITYGGVTLTKAVGDGQDGRMHTWLYYLKDNAVMDNTARPLNVTLGSSGFDDIQNMSVFYTVFAGVDLAPASYTTGTGFRSTDATTAAALTTAMAINADAQAVYVSSVYNSNNTTLPSYTVNANWTTGAVTNTGSVGISGDAWRNHVAKRVIPGSNTTDNAATSTINPTSRFSMSAMSLPKAPVVYTSITSGAWSSPGTWDLGSVPAAGSNVVIANGTSVNLTAATNTINSLNVNGTLDVSTFTLAGTGVHTVSGTGTLLVGASNFPSGFTTTTLAPGSTVNYNNAGAQTISGQTYSNLTLSGSGAKTLQTGTTSITGTLALTGTATTTTVVGLTIGNLNIGDGTTFNAAGFNLTVSGATTVGGGTNGNLNITSATGTKIFTGLVTINTGAVWTNTANSAVTFRGGITNNGTFNAGTGVHTFDNSAQQLTGTFSIPSVTVTGVTVTNNNTLTVATALSGSGGLTQAANAVLNLGGTSAITTLTASNSGNTVNYTGGAQTVHSNNYVNLTLTGSGAKTLQAGTTSITGNLTLTGTATTTTAAGLNIGGNLDIGDGTTFTAAGFALTVTGTTTVGAGVSGNLTISSATGAKIFTGLVTISPGGTWNNSGNSPVTVRGGITNNGTFTAGTGIYTFDTNAQALSGNAFTIPSVTITGITLTNNNALTVNTALSGTGTLQQAAGATLNIGAASALANIDATANGNTVNYTAAAGGQTLIGGTYFNVNLNNTSGTNTANGNVSVLGTMAANGGAGGTLSMSTFTLGGASITNNGTISTQNTSATPIPSGQSWSGTINYNATAGAQTVVIGTYTNLTSGNTSGINSAAGDLVINGILTTTALGTLSLGTHTISGTLTTINNNGTISTANTTATPLPPGLTWGGTINYNALTGAQTIVTGTYNNLTLGNTSGSSSPTSDLVVNGALTTTAGGTLDLLTHALTGTLSSVVNNGTVSTANTSTTPVPSGKTWGGNFIYAGAASQTVVPGTYSNLIILNTTGVALGGSATVNTSLSLSSSLTLHANDLTLGFTGAVTGSSSSVYIVTNSTGQLKRTVGASPASYPVGNSAYNPLTLTNTGTSDVYGINVMDGPVSTALDPALAVDRRWQIKEAVAGGSNLAITAQYNSGETIADFTTGNPIIGLYNGSAWVKTTATYSGGPSPFTFTSIANLAVSDLSTGTQYLALGKDYAFVAGPTQFAITSIVPDPVISGSGFQVTIEAQNGLNETSNVTTQTFFNLSTNGNAGALSGTISGSIPAGQSSVTLNGVVLSALGTGATITATLDNTNGGDALTPGTSTSFNVVASAISDIVTAGNETPNIDYKSKTGSLINTTSDGIRVWSFNVRDGGSTPDADNLATILNAITLTKGAGNTVTSWANTIQEAALFDGSTKVAEITVAGEDLAFTSLNGGTGVTVADNTAKTLDLYFTFKTANITDGQQFQFAITNANTTADAGGSLFSAFTTPNSSVATTNNRIQVTASQLIFGSQALTDVAVGASMTPPFTIRGVDINDNLDLEYTSTITLAVTGSTFHGAAPGVAAVAGVATFSPVFATTGTGVTITGSDGVITATPPSNPFNVTGIVPIVTDLFRSKTTGDWDQITTWQQSHEGTNWFDASVTPTNANSSSITVLNGHTVTIPASLPALTIDQTVINTGGQLTVGSGVTLTINDGTGTDLTATGILSVNGTVINQPTSSITGNASTLLFNAGGTYVHNQNGGAIITATWNVNSTCRITGFTNGATTALTNIGQTFGNFEWDCAAQSTALVTLQTGGFTGAAGTMTVRNTGTGSIYITSSTTGPTVVVGHYLQTGGTVVINNGNASRTLTVNGNFTLNQDNTTSSFQLSATGGSGGTQTLNVGGNFTMSAGTISRAGSGSTTNINFNGTTPQTFSKTGGSITGNVNFIILNNAIVDFGTSIVDGSSGTFNVNSGGSIITAHAQGLSTTNGTGSIQVTGTKTYNAAANYTYNGTAAQVTGNGLATANNLTINNTAGVSLTSATTVNGTLTLTNGLLSIGTVNLTTGASATISGASASSYVQTNNTGLLRRTVAASPVIFPVGNTAYNPITLTNTGTSDIYGITETDGSVPVALDPSFAVDRRWRITENTAGGSNLAVVAQYNSGEEAANFSTGIIPKIGFYNGTTWVENGATQAGAGPFTFTSTANFTPASLTTGTQYFALGKDQAFTLIPQGTLTAAPMCVSGTGQLTFTATSGTSPFTVVYNDGTGNVTQNGVISGTPFNVTPNPTSATTYTLVSVTDNEGDVRNNSFTGGSATITVHPALVDNTIAASQSVCSGAIPAPMTGSVPTGGNGTYSYLWQSSTVSATTNFVNAAGTNTGQNYTPSAGITQTTWYRRVVTSNGCTDNSTAIQVTITPAPTITPGPTLTASQSCSPVAVTLTGASFGAPATSAAWSIVSGGGTLSTTSFTATPATVTYTPAPGFTGAVTLALTTDACPGLSANRTINVNVPTIVNYDFNTGASFATLVSNAVPNVTATATGTSFATSATGTVTGGNAFTVNSTAGNSLSQTATANNNWTFTLTGPDVKFYKTFRAYFLGQRNSGTNPQNINILYSIDGGAFVSLGNQALNNTGTWVESTWNLPVAADNPTTSVAVRLNITAGNGTMLIDNFQMQAIYTLPTDKTPVAATSPVCENTGTNIQIPLSQLGVNYQLRNNTGNINIGSAVAGNGSTINLPTGNLSTATTFNVLASNSCSVQMANTVTVNITPLATLNSSLTPPAVCTNTPFNYTPTSAAPGTTFSWNRPVVAGISNSAATGTGDPNETLINTTATPQNVTYHYTLTANGCTNPTVFDVVVVVNPSPALSSTLTPPAVCDGNPFQYIPTSETPGASFNWSRAAVAGISNAPATGTDDPNETLFNTTTAPVNVTYAYTLSANGCANPTEYNVVVAIEPSPSAVATDVVVENTAGVCGATLTLGDNVTTNGTLSFSVDGNPITMPHTFPIGTTNVTVTAENNCGTSTTFFDVIVTDTEAPVVPTLADVTGECSATVTAPTTTDNCAGTVTGTTTDPLTYSTQGTFVITWTFDDGNGNVSTATQNVVVDDVTAPVEPTLADVTGECAATATAPTTTDNCAGTITGTTTDPLTYSTQGTFVITWTFDDGNGNITTATQNVVVDDVTAPVEPTLADVTGECSATATVPTTTDNCSGTITGTTTDPLSYSTQGTHVITWTFDDGNGNITTATQNVVVDDVTAPVEPTLADVTGECAATATAPTTTDNCSGTITGTTTDPLSYSTQGTHVITWTFDDGNGNITTATQNVVIDDVTAPVEPTLADVTGECAATATVPTTTDNCSGTITGTTTDPLSYSTQGTHVITWTFDDGNGNITTATQNVVIDDVTAPVEPTLADVTGECSATATVPTTTDNCSGTITGTTTDALSYSTQGTHVITWTFDDGNGNITTATQNVVIDDVTAPVEPTLADVTGECAATATAPTTTDNCSGTITGTTTDPLTYSTQGTHVITWTFDDGNGNITTVTQNVIVDDVTAPVEPTLADVTGECAATATAPTTTDNCSGTITGTTTDPLSYSTQGTHVITWTFDDGNGNITTVTQNVIVDDVTAPVEPTLADVTGECSATVTAPTTTDNCSGTITGTTTDPLSYSTQGTHVITWTFDDGNGNITTVTQNVIVDDVTAPVEPTLADVTGECSTTVTAPTTTDNCSGTITGTTTDPLSYSTQGTHVITWTFDDGNGNITTATQNVVIDDVTAPVEPTLADVTGECAATATAPTTTDNCSGTITGTTTDALSYSTQGTHVITWTFDDGNGNITTATQNVVVDDVTAPVEPTLADVTGECAAAATAPTTTDNCAGTITGTTTDPLSYSTQGTHVITWTFDDGNGNITTATQNVVVDDVTAPVEPTLADVTGACTATATAPTTTDNCSGIITGTTTDPLTYSTQGTRVITWTFDDGNGNITTATQNVIINDATPPAVPSLPDITGECSATATPPTTIDNCTGGIITGTTTDALTYSTQGTHVITWTFDDGNGNTSTGTQNVIIDDVTAPVEPTLADITGECAATATAPTTTDNCSGTITGTTTDPLTYSTQGTHVITWTFDDGNGNITTATQNVVIDDVTAPVEPTLADVTGECSATATAPTTTDNCSGTITGTTTDALSYTTQGTHVITWTFDDGNGNITTATQNVVVDDVTAPVEPTLADVTGECLAAATAPTTTDNCAGTITGTTTDPLSYSTQGTHVITWTFDDGNGNITTATQNVVVDDVTAPVEPTLADVTGECAATATAPTTLDNCSGTITGTTTDPLTYSTQGTHVITWTFDDGNGNITTTTQNVIITDVTPPATPTLADLTAECSVTATAPTTTDNCSGTITGTTTDPLTYSTQGTHVITWTFDDGNGNTSTANQNVIITDVTPPAVPVLASVTGQCAATATAPTTTDNCAGTITGTTTDPLSYSTQGTHVITWSFDDGHGNISTANQNVVISDVTPPAVPVLANVLGECTATATAPATTDNCSGTITGTTTDPLTYSTQGTHVITWSFNDGHGNISTATQHVIIQDVTGPTVSTPANALDATLECDDATGLVLAESAVPTATDNCGQTPAIHLLSDVTTQDPLCPNGYTRVRTWNFTDANNNPSPSFVQTIIVRDQTPPFVVQMPADVTVNADANCQATSVNLGILSALDNCSPTVTITNDHPSIYPIGNTIVTWTIKDDCNNTITRQQTVRVLDQTNPVIANCPADITVFTGPGALTCNKGVSWTAPSASDNCGVINSFTSNFTPGAVFPVGTTLVTYVATDASTNSSTCSFNVTVVDNTVPVINNCPANIVTCNPAVTWTAPTATDNCGVTTFNSDAPASFPVGVTTVTYTAKDAAGNTTTCSFTVTVNPTPNALAASNSPICAGNTLSLSAAGGTSYAWTGPNGFSSSQQNPSINLAGATATGTYTVVVSNNFGCSATATTNVAVNASATATAGSNSPVCTGGSLNLSASGGVSYSWTGPNGFVSLQQNPTIVNVTNIAGGIYTVTVTNAAGCTAQAFTSVSVGAAGAFAANNGPLCEGSTLSLSAAGGVSYAWSGPNGFSSTQQNPAISNTTTAASGTYTVTVTGSGGCTATATTNVTVSAVPTALAANNGPVCQGGTLSLSAAGGTSYSWTGPNGFSSFQQNPVLSNIPSAAAGFYTVTVSNAAGCTSTAITQVVVNAGAPASAASNSPVCTGSTLTLFASAGASYAWTGPNGFSSILQNPTLPGVTNTANGIYTVTVTNASGCTSTTSTSVTVSQPPVASASGNGPLCEGATLNLSASGGVSYSWTGPNGFLSNQQNPSLFGVTTAATGLYTVSVSNAGSCSSQTSVFVQVNAVPVASASSNSPVCAGTTLNLLGGGGSTYSWTGPNGFSSTQQNPAITNATAAAGGTYTLTVTNAAGCTSTTTTSVTMNTAVTASASSNSPVCAGAALNLFAGGGVSYSWTGPNGFNSTQANPTIAGVTAAAVGTYTVIVTSADGCTQSTTTSVAVNAGSVGGVVNGSTSVCAGSNSGTLNLTGNSGNVIRWEMSTDGGGSWSTISNTTTSLTYNNLTQTSQYQAIVQSAACASAISAPATVTVNGSAVGGTVSGSTAVCNGTNSGTVTLSGQSGTITKWQFSTDGGGSWTDIANTTTSQSYNNLTQTTLYHAVISGCTTVNSASATITVNNASVGGTVNASTSVCSGSNSGTLNVTGHAGSVIRWESSTDGGGSWSTISNTTTSQSYNNLTQTTMYRAVVQSGSCTPSNSVAATVTISATAVGGTVSGSTTVCTGTNSGTVTLSGQSGAITKWQFSTDGGGSWTDIANTTTSQSYNNLTQPTQYRAVITGCTTVNSGAATITVTPASVGGTLSGSTTVCSGSNSGTMVLSGHTGNVIRWEFSSDGGGSWSTISNTTTSQTYTNLTATRQYRAVVLSGVCVPTNSAAAIITVGGSAVGGSVSGSTTVCSGSNSGTLTLSGHTGTINKWQSSINGGGLWTDIANTTTSQTYANLTQTTQYRAVINGCATTVNSGAATVTVSGSLAVSITASDAANEFCNSLTLTANASVPVQSYLWSNGATTQSTKLGGANAAGNYTVTVTAAGGCTGTATYSYAPQAVASNYTILGLQTVNLAANNTVQNGSVGANAGNGSITIGNTTSVAAAGAFVKAQTLTISATANVPVRINAPAAVQVPVMQYNTTSTSTLGNVTVPNNTNGTVNGNFRNLTIGTNCNVTLTGTIFRLIAVGAGSTIRFTQPVINIGGINMTQGTLASPTTVAFSQATVVKSNADINMASMCTINPDNYKVVFYIGVNTGNSSPDFNVSAGGNVTVNASVFVPNGDISVGGSNTINSFMNGKFIASLVRSTGQRVIWNSFDCSTTNLIARTTPGNVSSANIIPTIESEMGSMSIAVTPVPTESFFTLRIKSTSKENVQIKIYDIVGRQIEQLRGSPDQAYRFGGGYMQGSYVVEVHQGNNVKVMQVVKL